MAIAWVFLAFQLELLALGVAFHPLEHRPLVAFPFEVLASLGLGLGEVACVLPLVLVVDQLGVHLGALVYLGLELVLVLVISERLLSCSCLLGCTCFGAWVEQVIGDGSRERTLQVCSRDP